MATIYIEGVEDVLRMFDDAPKELQKSGRKAMAAAGRKVAAQIKRNIPSRWKKLIRSNAKVARSGDIWANMGMFNRHEQEGAQAGAPIDDWFKAYWKNYGTLTRRDPSHHFDNKIRGKNTPKGRRRRNDIGQPYHRFFESSVEGWESLFYQEFEQSLRKQGYDV